MEKLDLTKKYKSYYIAKPEPEIVNIEPAHFLSITGKGDPSERAFTNNIEALYPTVYTLKFMFKDQGKDFVAAKLEGLWWYDESKFQGKTMTSTTTEVPRSEWEYRLMIRLPEFVDEKAVLKSIQAAYAKKGNELIKQVEYFQLHEGKCIQMMHIGPFETEPVSLQKIMEYSAAHNLEKNGYHHEIYLSDFRKTAPEKLRTILREPVK